MDIASQLCENHHVEYPFINVDKLMRLCLLIVNNTGSLLREGGISFLMLTLELPIFNLRLCRKTVSIKYGFCLFRNFLCSKQMEKRTFQFIFLKLKV